MSSARGPVVAGAVMAVAAALVAAAGALVPACALTAAPPVFPSRVALEPLLVKLAAAGGDPAKVLRVHSEEELSGLRPGRRYKYVVLGDGAIRVAPRPADEPGNEYSHPVLAGGRPVRTAGVLRFERRGATTTNDFVVVDQDSQAYCPTFASLGETRSAFARIGVGIQRVRTEDHPPICAARDLLLPAGHDAGLDASDPASDGP